MFCLAPFSNQCRIVTFFLPSPGKGINFPPFLFHITSFFFFFFYFSLPTPDDDNDTKTSVWGWMADLPLLIVANEMANTHETLCD